MVCALSPYAAITQLDVLECNPNKAMMRRSASEPAPALVLQPHVFEVRIQTRRQIKVLEKEVFKKSLIQHNI